MHIYLFVSWNNFYEAFDAVNLGRLFVGHVVVPGVPHQQPAVNGESSCRAAVLLATAASPVDTGSSPFSGDEPEPIQDETRRATLRHRVPHHASLPALRSCCVNHHSNTQREITTNITILKHHH